MLEAAMVIGGVLKGPIFAVFSVGMLVPWVNSKGILVGFFGSLLTITWIATGGTINKHYAPYNSRTSPPYPRNVSGCPEDWVFQAKESPLAAPMPGHLALYDISYVWYMVLGAAVAVILALSTTLFTSQNIRKLDRKLLSPVLPKTWSCLPKYLADPLDRWWDCIGQDLKPDGNQIKMKLNGTIEE